MPTEAASASAVALAVDAVFAVDSHSENGHDAASPGSDGLDDEGQRARGEDDGESAAVMVDADGADAPVVVGGTVAVGIAIEPPRDESHLSAADRPASYNSVQAARRLQSGATRGSAKCLLCFSLLLAPTLPGVMGIVYSLQLLLRPGCRPDTLRRSRLFANACAVLAFIHILPSCFCIWISFIIDCLFTCRWGPGYMVGVVLIVFCVLNGILLMAAVSHSREALILQRVIGVQRRAEVATRRDHVVVASEAETPEPAVVTGVIIQGPAEISVGVAADSSPRHEDPTRTRLRNLRL